MRIFDSDRANEFFSGVWQWRIHGTCIALLGLLIATSMGWFLVGFVHDVGILDRNLRGLYLLLATLVLEGLLFVVEGAHRAIRLRPSRWGTLGLLVTLAWMMLLIVTLAIVEGIDPLDL